MGSLQDLERITTDEGYGKKYPKFINRHVERYRILNEEEDKRMDLKDVCEAENAVHSDWRFILNKRS